MSHHRRLIRGIAAALGLAVAVAAAAPARPDPTGASAPTTAWAEPRIGSNHNQVLL